MAKTQKEIYAKAKQLLQKQKESFTDKSETLGLIVALEKMAHDKRNHLDAEIIYIEMMAQTDKFLIQTIAL